MKENNKIIAYITLRANKNVRELGLLAVLKKYQKMGIGNRLLIYILQIARKNSLKK